MIYCFLVDRVINKKGKAKMKTAKNNSNVAITEPGAMTLYNGENFEHASEAVLVNFALADSGMAMRIDAICEADGQAYQLYFEIADGQEQDDSSIYNDDNVLAVVWNRDEDFHIDEYNEPVSMDW